MQTQLDLLMAKQREQGKVVKRILVGQAASEIVKYAAREKIDLIVLGTRGRGGLVRVVLGSVAEEVVRTAPCQVMTIGPKTVRREEALVAESVVPTHAHCAACGSASPRAICDTCREEIHKEVLLQKKRDEQAKQMLTTL